VNHVPINDVLQIGVWINNGATDGVNFGRRRQVNLNESKGELKHRFAA
jgi:hypothetical protein